MNIGKYILRSVKYLVKLIVLIGLLFLFMVLTKTSGFEVESGGGIGGFLSALLATTRGKLFFAALVVWCAVYPSVEFVKRRLNYDMATHRDAIVKAMRDGAMVPASDEDGKMVFRGESPLRRIWFLGDEAVTITQNQEGGFDAEGPRRFVSELQHRITRYV